MKGTLKALTVATAILALGATGYAQGKNRPAAVSAQPGNAFNSIGQVNERPQVNPGRPANNGPRDGRGPSARPPRPDRPPIWMIKFWEKENVIEEIGLTEEQIASLAESFDLMKASLEEIEGDVPAARESLIETMDVDSPVLDDALAGVEALMDAKTERRKIVVSHLVVVKNVLTAEQEEALRDMRQDNKPGGPIRDAVREIGELVRDLAADDELSEEDLAAIQAAIDALDEEIRDEVQEIIDRLIERIELRPILDDIREALRSMHELVVSLAEDGELSDEDLAQVESALAELPAEVQDVVRPRVERLIERIQENGIPTNPGDGAGPHGPRGPEGPRDPGDDLGEKDAPDWAPFKRF